MDQTDKQIAILTHLNKIHALLEGDKELSDIVAGQLERLPVGKNMREILIARKDDLSYYNEKSALALIPILENLIATKQSWEASLAENPGVSLRTLYLRVYRPWLWLIDKHPESAKWAALRDATRIHQRPNHGVRISFKNDLGDSPFLAGGSVEEQLDEMAALQNRISEFLEMDISKDTVFEENKVSLTPTQVHIIKDSLAGLPNLLVKVEPRLVRILRKHV